MDIEQIAKRLSAHMYSGLEESERSYSCEEYWERNKHYFLEQAQRYFKMKESLEAQDLAAGINSEKRTEERTPLTSSIFYIPISEAPKHDKSWGVTIDVSHSGFSIYTSHALEKGLPVKVHSEDLWNNGRTARIIWCKEARKKLYRSGLIFE